MHATSQIRFNHKSMAWGHYSKIQSQIILRKYFEEIERRILLRMI